MRSKSRIRSKKASNKEMYENEIRQFANIDYISMFSSNEIKLLKKTLKKNSMISSLPDNIM